MAEAMQIAMMNGLSSLRTAFLTMVTFGNLPAYTTATNQIIRRYGETSASLSDHLKTKSAPRMHPTTDRRAC